MAIDPRAVVIIVTGAHPGWGAAQYLPPQSAARTKVPGRENASALHRTRQWLCNRMEQRRTLLLIDPDDGQQVLFYVPSLLCARALLYETLVLQVAEEESKRQAMEAAHRAREEEGAYDATRPVGEGAPEPEPEQVATAVPLAPEGHEISEEEAMARVAALEAERAAMEAADEAEDAAPAWGLPDEPGPPA